MSKSKDQDEPSAPQGSSIFSFEGLRLINPERVNGSIHMKPLSELAFFFDLDGTLLDLAATPDGVFVERGLQENLEHLYRRTAGAVAIVTGRSIEFVDQLFPQHPFSIAGLHGAEIRNRSGNTAKPCNAVLRPQAPGETYTQAFQYVRSKISDLAGLIFEDKGGAFALHYRKAPEMADLVDQIMLSAQRLAGDAYALQTGKFVCELKPAGADKAMAVRRLMATAPFARKTPIAAGDDVTDEAMFEQINGMGGVSIRVTSSNDGNKTIASMVIASPKSMRNWIGSLCQ